MPDSQTAAIVMGIRPDCSHQVPESQMMRKRGVLTTNGHKWTRMESQFKMRQLAEFFQHSLFSIDVSILFSALFVFIRVHSWLILCNALCLDGCFSTGPDQSVSNPSPIACHLYFTLNTFITSSPRWLMTFTAMRPDDGLSNGRLVSLWRDCQASSLISAFSVVFRDL